MLAYRFLLSYPFFNLFRISPCTEEERFWATTLWDVTVRVLHSSITSVALRTASWTFFSHFRENVMLKFFLIPNKNGLYLKMKLTTSKFKRIKRSYAGGLLKRNYITYIIFFSFFFVIFPTITSVGWWKTKHIKGYYGLLELFIPVTQDLKFVFSG